jgi:hypothetical protein
LQGGLKKRKRAKNQKAKGPHRTRAAANLRKRGYTAKRKRRKATLSARRAARSVSSSSVESDSSCSTCKRPCRSVQREKPDEPSCASQSVSGSFRDSIPASKHISPDASQYDPCIISFENPSPPLHTCSITQCMITNHTDHMIQDS